MNRQHTQLVDRIEASGKELLDAFEHLTEEEIQRVPAIGEWSIHQTMAHVRDTEKYVFLERSRRILTETDPPIVQNFDQDEWNREHYSTKEPLKNILSDFRASRRSLVKNLRASKDKDWSHYAVHPMYGKISLEYIATHNYSHTLDHIHQLLEIHEGTLLKKLNN